MIFRGKGPQPKFGERLPLSVQAYAQATRAGQGVYFSVARADQGEPIDVEVRDAQGRVLLQGAVTADGNGDAEHIFQWSYPPGEYRLSAKGKRSGKSGSRSFRV